MDQLNPNLKAYLLELWTTTEWEEVQEIPILRRCLDIYYARRHKHQFMFFGAWLDYCSYEELLEEFTEHEIMEIGLAKYD